jgi:hypothetical protein
MKNTYLTVDLDFWAKEQVDIAWLRQVLEAVAAEDRAAAVYHDSILSHARRYMLECTTLVNLDCHSDLGGGMEVLHTDGQVDFRRLELHEGSWGDYVAFADKAEFVWAYPHSSCLGNCRCDHFSDDGELPFRKIPQAEHAAWARLRCYHAKPPRYGVAATKVRAVSLVLSPHWCGADAFATFRALVRDYQMELLDCLPGNLKTVQPPVTIVNR